MKLEELKTTWQNHEIKLEKSARLNLQILEMIQSQQARSLINPLMLKNTVILMLHAFAIIALIVFLVYNISILPYSISAFVLLGYYMILFVNCYKQIMEIRSFNSNKDVISMQSSLAKLKMQQLNFIRLSVLTIPAFLSFPVVVPKAFADLNMNVFHNFDIIKQTNGSWWLVEILAFAILIPLGIWFYKNVTPQNVHINWVKQIINTTASKNVERAVKYLRELEEMKRE
jgi:hypothetical protein